MELERKRRLARLNHDTFDHWTEKNAWALGLITADGSLGGKARPQEFKLYGTDMELLEAVKEVFQSDKAVFVNQNIKGRIGKKPVGSLFLSSPKMMAFFRSINAVGDKDARNPFSFVPDQYKWAFIKGLFDGDGNGYKGQFSIAGRKNIIHEIYQWICQQIGKSPNKIHNCTSTNRTFYFQMGRTDSKKIFELIERWANGTYNSEKYRKLAELLSA